nr:hypothetical protein [Thermotoga sp. SG1]
MGILISLYRIPEEALIKEASRGIRRNTTVMWTTILAEVSTLPPVNSKVFMLAISKIELIRKRKRTNSMSCILEKVFLKMKIRVT